jgi:hypothetical protein
MYRGTYGVLAGNIPVRCFLFWHLLYRHGTHTTSLRTSGDDACVGREQMGVSLIKPKILSLVVDIRCQAGIYIDMQAIKAGSQAITRG